VSVFFTCLSSYKDNQLGPEGAIALALALQNNNTLTTFDFGCMNFFHFLLTDQGNNIGSKGAIALALALQHNKALTTLDLGCIYFLLIVFSPTSREQNWIRRSKCIGIGIAKQQCAYNFSSRR
jgi:hypothetical protein